MARFFDKMFDFNHDGKLSDFERAAKWGTIAHAMDESMKEEEGAASYDASSEFDDLELTDLELAGIDPDDLEFMDEDERRETLEDAGLDPDDYDMW